MKRKALEYKFLNDEIRFAYEKGKKIVEDWGEILYGIDPIYHQKVPSDISHKIGVGAAAAIWTGIHASGQKLPFARTTPAYGLFQAGRQWAQIKEKYKPYN
jgi:hypothetical protein